MQGVTVIPGTATNDIRRRSAAHASNIRRTIGGVLLALACLGILQFERPGAN